jgi:twinkle protein
MRQAGGREHWQPVCGERPEGAPPPSPDHANVEAPSGSDAAGKFRFMWNNRERLARIKRFVLAVDNDPPGKRLADELIRRLLASRCLMIRYPDDCKDPNDVVLKCGAAALLDMLNNARLLPIDGVYSLSDYPERDFVTYRTGLPNLDKHFLLFEGQFVVVTGTPGHGKDLDISTPILTPSGWSMMGDLAIGDTVFDETGKHCLITGATEVMVGRPCYRCDA